MPRLFTFMVSHYSEKARWALDHKRTAYDETPLLPGPHTRTVRKLAPKTTVPVLADGDRAVQGSSAIIDYADERWPEHPLSPDGDNDRARAAELEPWLDREVGETLRRIFYGHLLRRPRVVIRLFSQRGPWWAPGLYRVAFPMLRSGLRRMYEITPETVAGDERRLADALARLDELLDGRDYLVGDRFSRADLTLAALTAPMWRPPQHPSRWPAPNELPPALRSFIDGQSGTRVEAHARRMYERHRRAA